jgi:hypothetical protein
MLSLLAAEAHHGVVAELVDTVLLLRASLLVVALVPNLLCPLSLERPMR